MKTYKAIFKRAVIVIFTTFLTLLFLLSYICIGLGIGLFSDKSIQRSLSNSKYYDELYSDLNNKAEKLVKQGGLPSSVLKDVITFDRVYSQGQNYFSSVMAKKQPEVYSTEITTLLQNNINDYLVSQKIERTNEIDTTTNKIVQNVGDLYQDSLEWQFINSYSKYKVGYWYWMKYLAPVLLVAIGFICYILLRIHSFKRSGLWFINYALLASTSIISIMTITQLLRNTYISDTVSPDYYRSFLIEYFRWGTMVFVLISCCAMIFSFLMIKVTKYKLQYDDKE